VDEGIRQEVIDAAVQLDYRLNITIHDVADLAHVSIATVSYAINNSAPVSESTRLRVQEATRQLGYRPNITARNLKAGETRMIGYAWHEPAGGQISPVLDRFIYCLALAAESYGYHGLTFTQPEDNAVGVYEDLIRTNRVDGFIVSNTNRDDPRIKYLISMGVPFAAFGRANDSWDFCYVDVDGRRGIELAVEHLLERGHRRIGLIGWPEGSLAGDHRLQGYIDALTAANIPPHPAWIARAYNAPKEGGIAAQQLWSLPDSDRPTALVCVDDTLAIGAMQYFESIGVRVGIDVAVTGFDDSPMSEFLRPSLTSLRQPIELLARQLIDLLIARIENHLPEEHQLLLSPTLITRASSARLFTDVKMAHRS
ncbi:MAG TPA: LacI family DNA-binding transcriptional regulator, partial [Aggregatilineales bacterium]|nr:LacI family DNA-binding transcriptional regulator [Aggregatilineales bacterium]